MISKLCTVIKYNKLEHDYEYTKQNILIQYHNFYCYKSHVVLILK